MRRIIFAALIVALAACSKDKDVDAPAKLANIQATLQVERVWSADVGGQKVPLRLGLALAVAGERPGTHAELPRGSRLVPGAVISAVHGARGVTGCTLSRSNVSTSACAKLCRP